MPETGDLVAVKSKNSPEDIWILQPFDTIYWNKGGLYNPEINGEKLNIPSFKNSKSNSDMVTNLKRNEYFSMSDNCGIIGRDSRTMGSFFSEEIIGVVSFVINNKLWGISPGTMTRYSQMTRLSKVRGTRRVKPVTTDHLRGKVIGDSRAVNGKILECKLFVSD